MKKLKHYLLVYAQILRMMLSYLTEYRLNVIVQGLFGVVYLFGMYFLVLVVFSKTPSLGGWSKDEVILLMLMYIFIWGVISFFFFNSFRVFTYIGVRMGDADRFLTKPLSPEVFISMAYPDSTAILQEIVVVVLLVAALKHVLSEISLISVLLFSIFMLCSIIIIYLVTSTYATFSFYFTEATEIMRSFVTISDSSQYPVKIYPDVIQPILFSFFPIAFMSYIPTSFLIGKGTWQLVLITIVVMILAFVTNRIAWHYGWKRYTSASS